MAKPARKSNKPCHDYCCSAFATFKDNPVFDSADLDNDIHPILQRDKFPQQLDYSVVEPSLRLATHLLQSDAMVVYVNAMFDGEYRSSDGKIADLSCLEYLFADGDTRFDKANIFYPKPGQEQANLYMRARAAIFLEQLADMVDLDFMTDPTDQQNHGALARRVESPLSFDCFQAFPGGCRTRIDLNWCLVNRLHWVTTDEELLLARFNVARIITHELMHAATWAVFGDVPCELYYKDCPLSEAGYELEAQCFGGLIEWSSRNLFTPPWDYEGACTNAKMQKRQDLIVLWEWPSDHTLQDYTTKGTCIGCRRPFRQYDILWRIPMSFLEALFTNEFWTDNDIQQQGTSALLAPRIASWMFKYHQNLPMTPVKFESIEEQLGGKRARQLCCCDKNSEWHRPGVIPEDAGEILATTGDWMHDCFRLTNRQRKRKQRKEAKEPKTVEELDGIEGW